MLSYHYEYWQGTSNKYSQQYFRKLPFNGLTFKIYLLSIINDKGSKRKMFRISGCKIAWIYHGIIIALLTQFANVGFWRVESDKNGPQFMGWKPINCRLPEGNLARFVCSQPFRIQRWRTESIIWLWFDGKFLLFCILKSWASFFCLFYHW